MTERLSFEQVVEFNRILCVDTGENSALLDPDGLDAALERPWSGFGDTELFPTLFEKAAALLHAIASRQVFENGNKRTAWASAVAFLDLNGIDIGKVETVQADMFVRAAALDHSLEVTDIAEWFSVAHEQATQRWHQGIRRRDGGTPAPAEDTAELPLALVQSSGDAALASAFPDGEPTPETPLGTAMLWWLGLADVDEYRNALERLSLDPSLWGDYKLPAAAIADRSITTVVEPCPGDEAIKHVKFIEFAGDDAAVAVADAPLTDVFVLTLVKPADSDWWLVWGLSHNRFPPATEIRGPSS